jgi:hypothetical protein
MPNLTTSSAIDTFMQAADAAAAQTALGLGNIATQAASAVSITGGTIAGLTQFGVSMANNTAMTGFALGTISDTTSRPFSISQTWNNAGLTAKGLVVDITNTSSNAASRALDVIVSGASLLYVTNTSVIAGGITLNNNTIIAGAGRFTFASISSVFGVTVASDNCIAWENSIGNGISATRDLLLYRGSAASLRMGNALASAWVNQSFGASGAIIGTTTNGSPTNTMTIHGSVSTGTGTGGNIVFGVYGTNGSSGTAIGTLNTVLTIVAARKVLNLTGIPTSSAGLSAGDVYSNAGILTIV